MILHQRAHLGDEQRGVARLSTRDLDRLDAFGIHAAPESDDVVVATAAGNVDPANQSVIKAECRFASLRCRRPVRRDQLQVRRFRELAADPDADKVAVLAVVIDPLLDLRLVGTLDVPAVDLARNPAVLVASEALAEPAGVTGRVAECNPDNLGVLVGQRPFGHFPHLVSDVRRLIEHQDDALAIVVQARERLCVVLRPRHRISPPALFVARVVGVDRRRRWFEPMRVDRQPEPLRQLWAGLGSQLVLCVGREYDLAVLAGRHCPMPDHPDLCRLADTVTGCHRNHQRLKACLRVLQVAGDVLHHPLLPIPRALRLC